MSMLKMKLTNHAVWEEELKYALDFDVKLIFRLVTRIRKNKPAFYGNLMPLMIP